MRIYLVRHLPTEFTRLGLFMGRSHDLPILQETIQSFAQNAARLVPESTVNRPVIYSSPAQRCRQTAVLLQRSLGNVNRSYALTELHETNYGSFEGKSPQEIKHSHPEIFRDWMERPSWVRFPEGETFVEVQHRASNCVQGLITRHRSSAVDVYLVTHVDVIKMLLCWLLDISIDHKRLFRVDTGSFTCLETTDEIHNKKKLRVRYLNLRP